MIDKPVFDATNHWDMAHLAVMVLRTPQIGRAPLVTGIMYGDLMRFQNWSVRFAVWMRIKVRRHNSHDVYKSLFADFPQLVDPLLRTTAAHIIVGKDTSSEDSVGGFSQREVNLLSTLVAICSGTPADKLREASV